jgi:5-methylcytosine-specific restriction endonuclease McrA
MGGTTRAGSAVDNLLDALGIDAESYQGFVAGTLAEQLVSVLAEAVATNANHKSKALWDRPDGRKRFRGILRETTGRTWSIEDEERLFERVRLSLTDHDRKPIRAEDLLRLLWNSPHTCANCGKFPPGVKLHVDHIFPASRGGSSRFENLQFLCASCNLRKSNKIEVEDLWLNSV